jgi:hypothetical protein
MTIKVKPLEWRPEPPYHVARVFGNVYAVEAWDGGATLSGVGGRRDFNTLSEAKAAAQADYEARILSALAPQVGDNAEEPVAWRWESAYGGEPLIGKWNVATVKPTRFSDATAFACEPLYTHPCTSTPVVSQNSPALEDKGGDGWQPIETAPKDGSFVDLWVEFYDQPEGDRKGPLHWTYCRWNGEAWENSQGLRPEDYMARVVPTHWMREPKAPYAPEAK